MAWVWKQTGELIMPTGILLARGYSGHGEGVNNPALQAVHDVGPVPVGSYVICEPAETHGGFALPLQPDSGNEMFGRAGFLIHGDEVSGPPLQASLGCIILSRWVRMQIWASGDRQLTVVSGEEGEAHG